MEQRIVPLVEIAPDGIQTVIGEASVFDDGVAEFYELDSPEFVRMVAAGFTNWFHRVV